MYNILGDYMLDQVIKDIKKTGLIEIIKGKNSNVLEYFKNTLNCSYVPKQVVEFYSKYDGARFTINDMYSLKELKDLASDFKYESKAFKIKYEDDMYIPIADDGMGGYYVFSSNKKDNKIYWIDSENIGSKWFEYKDLADFLDDMNKAAIYCNENE